ncbi:MAG: hypothetical protein DME97_06950 [Verrucomicrobia bacterium]|nr:MAG: hypothetical protein DME97_06950 [Verrucomicrobiota bacterium]
MTHGGGAGTFNLPLPLTGNSGIEGRSDGTSNYTVVLTFDTPVNGGSANVTNHTSNCDNNIPVGTGSVSSVSFSGNDMIVTLTGVTDQQVLTLSATGVTGTNGSTGGSGSVPVGFLWGNVNTDRIVNAGDTLLVRDNAGVTLDNTNFQYDVNLDGGVNVGDTTTVRNNSAHCVP